MPEIYLDTPTFQQASADTWERDANHNLAERWASQAMAQAPQQVADAQDRADQAAAQQQQSQFIQQTASQLSTDAQNQQTADQWASDAAAKYATINPPESPQDAQQPTQGDSGAASTTDQTAATVAPPQSIPMAPVPMGPAETAAPVTNTAPTQQPGSPTAPVSAPLQASGSSYEAMAQQAAQKYGLDPNLFVAQLNQESGLQPYNPDGSVKVSPAGARGIAQFMPATAQGMGINPDDPAQAIDGAARMMAQLRDRYGGDMSKALAAYNAGPGSVDKYGGIPPFAETQAYVKNILGAAGQAVQQKAQDVAQAVQSVGQKATTYVSQFAMGLSNADAAAFCGPAAAIAFAKTYGRNPTVDEAKALAQQVGWNADQGMAGVSSEQKLLQSMGVPASIETQVDWNHVAQDAAGGNPVILDTPGHYYYVDGVQQGPDGQQQFHVGKSGTVYKGGGEWMTAAQINALPSGQVRAALYADHPLGPGQSVATTQAPPQPNQPTYMDALQPADTSPQPSSGSSPFDPLKQIGDTISSAITTGLQKIFGTSDQSTGVGQVTDFLGNQTPLTPQGFRNDLQAAGNAVRPALDVWGQSLESGGTPLLGQGAQALAQQDVPLLSGAAGAVAPILSAPGPIQSVGITEDLAHKYGTFDTSQYSPEDQQRAAQATMAIGGVTAPVNVDWGAALNTPVNQRVVAGLNAAPAVQQGESFVNNFVRATTNRFEAADRFQEQTFRSVGIDPANPPQNLDLSAALRLASNPAAEVRIQQGLAPAIQMMGDDKNALQALSTYLIHQNNIDVATALGAPFRRFSGGLTVTNSQDALRQMQNDLGPQGWQHLQQAAGQVYDFTNQLRQRMVDSGLISADTAQQWQQQYPHWVPTRILDYIDETKGPGPAVGSKISLGDNQVRSYTEEGTNKFREDPLASLVGLAGQVERLAMKNEAANALVDLNNLLPQGQQMLTATDRAATAGESVVQRINNGTVERYLATPQLAAVINGPAIAQAPSWVRAWTGFIRSMATVLSPTFALVRNPSLDIPEYMTRELARAGGNPLQLPHIVAELAKGYADAFQGFHPLTEGTFAGPGTQQFMLGGGGQSGMVGRTFADRADAVARLAQDGNVINNTGDVMRVLKDLVTLQPVARTAERTELGPRIASMRLAEQRGATPVRAVLNGRTVTLDFNEGGTVAKAINQFIPFTNAGIQGSANVVRMFRENPGGALTSAMMMAGLPAVAAEAWNNSDPQRAKDYADVPDYLKQQGVVLMMPGDAPVDDRGNRRPQFWWVNMRGLAPFSNVARVATQNVLQAAGGNVQPENYGTLLNDIFWSAFPIRANTIGDVPGSLSGQGIVPGADIGLQLALNKDIFRNADIVTPRRDQYASAVGKAIADGLTSVARTINPSYEVHPSQVDFAVQQALGGVGAAIQGAGNIVANQRTDNAPQSAPLVGGMVKALGVRGDTGQVLQDARAQVLTPDAQRVINDAGLQTPQPAPGTIHYQGFAIPLHQDEQARYQQLYSQQVSQLIARYAPQFQKQQSMVVRQNLLNQLSNMARSQAEQQVLRTIPGQEINQRVRDENARRAAGVR